MYSIKADSITIMNDQFVDEPFFMIEPELTLEENAAGSLAFSLTPNSVGYSVIQRMNTTLRYLSGNDILWEGRVVEEETIFDRTKRYTAEGALAYLNDTHQPLKSYKNKTVKSYVKSLLDVHNAKVGDNRKILLGDVTVDKTSSWVTNWDKTFDKIKEIVDDYDAHIQIRYSGEARYLDILADYPRQSSQTVEFGINLLDFTSKRDLSSLATVCIPLGKAKKKSSVAGQTEYLTCNPPYVTNDVAVSNFGWIEEKVNFDYIDKVSDLKKAAQNWLSDAKYDEMSIEVKALDLKRLGMASDELRLLDEVRFKCPSHGLDRFFPLTRVVIRPYEIDNSEYTFGRDVTTDLTRINNAINNQLIKQGTKNTYDTSFSGTATVDENETVVVNTSTLFADLDVIAYDVFLTPYSETSKLYVSEKTLGSFTVVGDSGATFYWELRNITVTES